MEKEDNYIQNKNTKNNLLEKIILEKKNDLNNIDIFWKNHKKKILWIFIIFITLQFIDIISLSYTLNNICNTKSSIQKGGESDVTKGKVNTSNNSVSPKPSKGKSSYTPFQSFKTTGPLGNVIGKFGVIFGNAFKLIGVILLIAVIGFLPIIVLIVLTYKVITFMVLKVRKL